MKCKRCKRNELQEPLVMNSLSREDNSTYICNECGTEESLVDMITLTDNIDVNASNLKDVLDGLGLNFTWVRAYSMLARSMRMKK